MKLLLLNSFKANLVPQTVALNWTQLHTGPIGRSVCLVRLLVAAELFSDCALVIMAGSVLKNKQPLNLGITLASSRQFIRLACSDLSAASSSCQGHCKHKPRHEMAGGK